MKVNADKIFFILLFLSSVIASKAYSEEIV